MIMRRLTVLIVPALFAASTWTDPDAAKAIARRNYWAFQKPVRPAAPRAAAALTPIDAFIAEALTEKKLRLSPELDRTTLLRRVTIDLTGIPPSGPEVDAFLADRRPGAYERVVDRLMASPRYGERWALKWLDVVRYADTNGYEMDGERPHAWRYRDYVVRAFNAEKPYDRFLREQVAGDEMYPGNVDALVATGFHRAGPIHLVSGNQDEEMNRQEVLTEMTGGIGSVFLGLTVGCAKCHNHKFDPILQSDYYRLQGVLAATGFHDIDIATADEKRVYVKALAEWDARLKPVKQAIEEIEKPYVEKLKENRRAALDPRFRDALDIPKDKRTPEQEQLAKDAGKQIKPMWDEIVDALSAEDRARRSKLREQLHAVEFAKPQPPAAAYAVANLDSPPPVHILKVGDHRKKMAEVAPGVPVVFESSMAIPSDSCGRREALARWLSSPDHPLTARVMVNRIWQFRMGTGIVATPNDFGVLGARPSNPKLLDWLATEFIARKWSIKAIDRLIVTSAVYRQASTEDAAKHAIDPSNKLYWRMNRKRMEGETIRDAVLAASGSLNDKRGGPPIYIPIEPEVYDLLFTESERDGLWPENPDPAEHNRRSIYLFNKRTVRLPMLSAFDQPDTMTSCPVRPESTHALQALNLFNSDFMAAQSRALAARAAGDIATAYRFALSRPPRPEETKLARDFLAAGGTFADFALALLNRNEFVYVP